MMWRMPSLATVRGAPPPHHQHTHTPLTLDIPLPAVRVRSHQIEEHCPTLRVAHEWVGMCLRAYARECVSHTCKYAGS